MNALFKSQELISENLDDYENIKTSFSKKPKEMYYKKNFGDMKNDTVNR